jgi:pimeloyl-ACP methyl ester carboxylesterase
MNRRLTLVLALCALVAAAFASTARADTTLTGELGGAPYTIKFPTHWNGKLLVYAHGYVDKADHPGEVDNRSADASPNAGLDPVLLAQGYALAGSAYQDNGWAVKEGIHDTRRLAAFFNGRFGKPDTTLLWGFSMGSLVTFATAEEANGMFDGYIAGCAVGAGAPRAWDGALSHLLAYKVAFGMPASWGTPGDVRDDVDFDSEVFPKLVGEAMNPLNFGKFEFIRLVTQVGGEPNMLVPPPIWFPGGLFTNMFFLTEARAELERRAGGPLAQNLTHTYSLTAAEKAYLLGAYGLNADPLLAAMNGEDYAADPSARNYAKHYADYSGKIKGPMLTLHTRIDTLVPPQHEAAYAATVAAAGRSGSLYQAYTTGQGHCNFTGEQLLNAVSVLDKWVSTGNRPTAASFTAPGYFPYTPAPWPQP